MGIFNVIICALWVIPILGFLVFKWTKNQLKIRYSIVLVSVFLSILTFIGIALNVSFVSSLIDSILISNFYLSLSLLLFWTQYQGKKALKYIGLFVMIIVYVIGYFLSSFGLLALAFVIGDFEPNYEQSISKKLICKEYHYGMAIDDFRDREIQIHSTIDYLPFLEHKIKEKYYHNLITVDFKPLQAIYDQEENKVILTAFVYKNDVKEKTLWVDSISLNDQDK